MNSELHEKEKKKLLYEIDFVKKHILVVSNVTKCLVEHARISIKQRLYP